MRSYFWHFAFFSWPFCAFRFFKSTFCRAFSALYVCLSPKSVWETGAEKNAKYFFKISLKLQFHSDLTKVVLPLFHLLDYVEYHQIKGNKWSYANKNGVLWWEWNKRNSPKFKIWLNVFSNLPASLLNCSLFIVYLKNTLFALIRNWGYSPS